MGKEGPAVGEVIHPRLDQEPGEQDWPLPLQRALDGQGSAWEDSSVGPAK